MGLLRDIQDAAADSKASLPDLLRKRKLLAARLKHAELDTWVSHELNGYPNDDMLPSYRHLANAERFFPQLMLELATGRPIFFE